MLMFARLALCMVILAGCSTSGKQSTTASNTSRALQVELMGFTDGFDRFAEAEPDRFVVVDGGAPIDDVEQAVRQELADVL